MMFFHDICGMGLCILLLRTHYKVLVDKMTSIWYLVVIPLSDKCDWIKQTLAVLMTAYCSVSDSCQANCCWLNVL